MSRCFSVPFSAPLMCLIFAATLSGCTLVPRRAVVMDFENLTNDHQFDHLSAAIPESLITVMNREPESVYLLERQDMSYYLREIDKIPNPTVRMTRWQQLGRRMKVDYFVVGSVARFGKEFVVQARLFSVDQGDIVRGSAMAARCGSEEDILAICREFGDAMVRQISARTMSRPAAN